VHIGWVVLDTTSFKKDLILLASKLGLPFSEFVIDGIASIVKRWGGVLSAIHAALDPLCMALHTPHKILAIHTKLI
jgi:hypothetical protein